ncbi:MAG: deoxynucleoside kinase, partial [Ardenticatenaceae bacterium]
MRPSPIYIAIEGVIGVGKTTLARLLQPVYEAELVLETFEENPFLASFYSDPERYAFQAQVVFLLSRYEQQRRVGALAGRAPLISDYLFAKDRLFARLNLHGDEWTTYLRLHEVLAERIVQPDLVVFLRASVATLMARIVERGRSYERSMSRDYIARLAAAYDAFFARYDATPFL